MAEQFWLANSLLPPPPRGEENQWIQPTLSDHPRYRVEGKLGDFSAESLSLSSPKKRVFFESFGGLTGTLGIVRRTKEGS